MSETDEIHGAIKGSVRVALTVGAQVGEQVARELQRRAHETQAASTQRARELQARLDAERAAARSELAVVHRREWWDRARPQDVGHMWQVAEAWAQIDPVARHAADTIRDQVQASDAVDADAPAADVAEVARSSAQLVDAVPDRLLTVVAADLTDEQVERANLASIRALEGEQRRAQQIEIEVARERAGVLLVNHQRTGEQVAEDLAMRAHLDASLSARVAANPDFAQSDYLRESVRDALTARALDQVIDQAAGYYDDLAPILRREWERITAEAEADRAAAERARVAARQDELAAQAILADPLVAAEVTNGVEADASAEVLYDSADRRKELAAHLEHAGIDVESREARIVADKGFGTPARDAVATAPKQAPKARKARRAPEREQTRTLGR